MLKKKFMTLAIGTALLGATFTGAGTAAANDNSYTLSPSDTQGLYYNIQGDTTEAQVADFLIGLIPGNPGLSNGMTMENRQAIELAYHNNVGVRVTVNPGTYSFDAEVRFQALPS